MKYKAQLLSVIFLVLLILVVVSPELSSAEPSDHLMYPEDNSDPSVQFVKEDDGDQSFVPQHESAEDYTTTKVEFRREDRATLIYYATPGTQVDVRIEIEVRHDNFSYNLKVRVELCSVTDNNSNESESHGTKARTIYVTNPYRTTATFTLSNDSDAREYFVKISVLLPDDNWAIIYGENDSSFPYGRLSLKNPHNVDTDDDGLSDGEEIELGISFLVSDTDNDGLNDSYEFDLGTDPADRDTDNDGLNDSYELDLGTDPADRDTDGDYLTDGHELDLGTDPFDKDTDGDGLWDIAEVNIGTDPFDRDTDGDGLGDHYENDHGPLDPLNIDTDGDGLGDGREVDLGTDPAAMDTDGDGLGDGREVDIGTDPLNIDTDGDGLGDSREIAIGRNPRVPDVDDTVNYGSLTLFLGIFAIAFFIVTLTRKGTKR